MSMNPEKNTINRARCIKKIFNVEINGVAFLCNVVALTACHGSK